MCFTLPSIHELQVGYCNIQCVVFCLCSWLCIQCTTHTIDVSMYSYNLTGVENRRVTFSSFNTTKYE